MQPEQIQKITTEVMRRLELSMRVHKALLLQSPDMNRERVSQLVSELDSQGYAFTPCKLQGDSVPACDLPAAFDELLLKRNLSCADLQPIIQEHSTLIVGNLSIAQLSDLLALRVRGTPLCLVYEALRQGKQLYLFSRDLDVGQASSKMAKRISDFAAELESWGIEVLAKGHVDGVAISKDLISLQDLRDINSGSLVISKNASLTTTARKALEERGIHVIRKEK